MAHCATLPAMTPSKEPKTPFSVYLDPVDMRRLRVAAEKLQRSKADVARLGIRQYLDNLGTADPEGGSDASSPDQRQRRTRR